VYGVLGTWRGESEGALIALGVDVSGLLRFVPLRALSGTPTNVIFSVAHNDDSMNAKAPTVAANSTICTTMRAETTQPPRATDVAVIFSTSNKTAGAMMAKPLQAVRPWKSL
jgi:hypothetical protein